MDRFEWTDGTLQEGEVFVKQQNGIRVYDGPEKTAFDYGLAILTTFRLLWRDSKQQGSLIGLPLSQIVYLEEQSEGIAKSPKIVIHLHPPHQRKGVGPALSSSHSYIRLSFKEGGSVEFNRCLTEELSRKRWQVTASKPSRTNQPKKIHTGIVGIERKLEERRKETDQNISKAFEDLNRLMTKAKEMVELSKKIARKIKDKQGYITEDETVKFKSYLLSLGIANPVTRETHGSGLKYHEELAKQLADVLQGPIEESGGMIALTDVFCRVNRARGIELLSPDDLINACKQFERLKLPLRLRAFGSGVLVIESTNGEKDTIEQITNLLTDKESLTADELSQVLGISVMLAKGRLLAAEDSGKACRDESVEGLRFFPNRFLEMEAS